MCPKSRAALTWAPASPYQPGASSPASDPHGRAGIVRGSTGSGKRGGRPRRIRAVIFLSTTNMRGEPRGGLARMKSRKSRNNSFHSFDVPLPLLGPALASRGAARPSRHRPRAATRHVSERPPSERRGARAPSTPTLNPHPFTERLKLS